MLVLFLQLLVYFDSMDTRLKNKGVASESFVDLLFQIRRLLHLLFGPLVIPSVYHN